MDVDVLQSPDKEEDVMELFQQEKKEEVKDEGEKGNPGGEDANYVDTLNVDIKPSYKKKKKNLFKSKPMKKVTKKAPVTYEVRFICRFSPHM